MLLLMTTVHADSIRLLQQAGVPANAGGRDTAVTLADVAELEGEYAESLGDLVVGELDGNGLERSVQLATVRRVLTEARVNWADLSLRGRSVCVVSPLRAASETVDVDNDRAVTTSEALAIDQANAGLTVGDLIIEELVRFNDATPESLEIKFRGQNQNTPGPRKENSGGDVAWLNRSAAVGRYEIDVLSRSGLGVVPIKVCVTTRRARSKPSRSARTWPGGPTRSSCCGRCAAAKRSPAKTWACAASCSPPTTARRSTTWI
ncbi:MAG: hypothetical protein AAGL98_06875 [Planctomycetota bacterium]